MAPPRFDRAKRPSRPARPPSRTSSGRATPRPTSFRSSTAAWPRCSATTPSPSTSSSVKAGSTASWSTPASSRTSSAGHSPSPTSPTSTSRRGPTRPCCPSGGRCGRPEPRAQARDAPHVSRSGCRSSTWAAWWPRPSTSRIATVECRTPRSPTSTKSIASSACWWSTPRSTSSPVTRPAVSRPSTASAGRSPRASTKPASSPPFRSRSASCCRWTSSRWCRSRTTGLTKPESWT